MPTIPNVNLPAETVAQLLALPPAEMALVADFLDAHAAAADTDPPDDPEGVKAAWKAELGRRIESVRNGTALTHTLAESTAFVRKALDEARRQ